MPKREFELENSQEAISGTEKRTKIDCDDAQIPVASASGLGLAHTDYTVGWICAITTEYVAAQAFLDEKHEGPECVSSGDNNDYTLGKVGKHNVVIAVLPHGEYGISSATCVAKDMLHSFSNIRIGLMVGIGGGAPSPSHDIRLGDVVVSATGNGKGGVFQYDFGKTIQGREFQETGFLNQPPAVLRTAVNGLMAQYESDGHCLGGAINNILKKKPRLRKKYKRPEPSTDQLYKAEVDSSCVCGDDPLNLILRRKRAEDEDNPAIHYGLIASANRLMKDALLRDKLAKEKDVLCFEMEAAGLMNQFPCLVIRGICDYSDNHKNKEWQGYAAMVAAAYAKDLLCRIAPKRVEAEKNIGNILSDVREGLKILLHDQERRAILKWLTPINYAPQQSDYLKRRQPETGQWFLDSAEYQAWLKTDKQTLFCQGIPGAGKTILTSIVIADLFNRFHSDATVGIAYVYCNFLRKDEQNVDDLLSSLLKQLVESQSSLPGSVKDLYDEHKPRRTRPSLDEVLRVLQSVAMMYSRAFIIVDALDECQVSNDCRGRFLSELFSLQAQGANIFATSRCIPEIVYWFKTSVSVEIRAATNDVARYIEDHIGQLPSFVQENQQLQEEIKTGISEAVDGMFLLAQIYLGLLDDKLTLNDIQNALEVFRKQGRGSGEDKKVQALTDAYEKTMDRIVGQKPGLKKLAMEVLSWITCAKRPLTMSELQHALATKVGKTELHKGDLPDTRDMIAVCLGLVTIDRESGIIRLVHYTTQEYFQQTQKNWFPNAESYIATICVTYLSFSVFENGFCETDEAFEERLRTNQLYDYAAYYWGYHACKISVSCQSVIEFLEDTAKLEASSQALMALKDWPSYSQRVPRRMRGLHIAAYFGIKESMKTLLGRQLPDLKDSYGRTALSWAAINGHDGVVKLLLGKEGIELNSKDGYGWTALSLAAMSGHEAVVKLLLGKEGIELNSKDGYGWTALSLAARSGHDGVVKLLLDKEGIDFDSRDNIGQTALSWAAKNGHDGVVKLLLGKEGIDLNSKDAYSWTALSWAAIGGHEGVVKLLRDKEGIDLNSKDTFGWTALSLAARSRHEAVVKLLRDKESIGFDSRDNIGRTVLS
ncbi:MAG: hypothetical protein M1840_007248 [Geoglossum simile]|nr:MAG: hypothetical protein M1840_007248 [Geoglossum simile]